MLKRIRVKRNRSSIFICEKKLLLRLWCEVNCTRPNLKLLNETEKIAMRCGKEHARQFRDTIRCSSFCETVRLFLSVVCWCAGNARDSCSACICMAARRTAKSSGHCYRWAARARSHKHTQRNKWGWPRPRDGRRASLFSFFRTRSNETVFLIANLAQIWFSINCPIIFVVNLCCENFFYSVTIQSITFLHSLKYSHCA